jgi:hypothetical protein
MVLPSLFHHLRNHTPYWETGIFGFLRALGFCSTLDGDLDHWLLLLRWGLLWWCGDLGLCIPLLRCASSSLAVNLFPTNLNPGNAARCMCSLVSPRFGCIVYKYVCAATSAASGIFGMMLPCSSTDKKDESRFLERFRLSECSRFSTREPCLLCLLLFVCYALLRASCIALLAALTDSLLFVISLLSFAICLDCRCRA